MKINLKSLAPLVCALGLLAGGAAQGFSTPRGDDDGSAVVLIYHRFAEADFPSTNIRLEQFEEQLDILAEGGYSFPEPTAFARRIARGRAPADLSVLVTVDDAYRSVLAVAWPLLKSKGIPLILFVATDPVDEGHPDYLSWEEIRRLEAEGVVIGHHGAAHGHLAGAPISEALADIRKASRRFEDELGHVPKLFAYPYGEYSKGLVRAVRRLGFTIAFAQYSGAIGRDSPTHYLPRFAINENFGDASRFRLVTRSRALPVERVDPPWPQLAPDENPPVLRFLIGDEAEDLNGLACYPSHIGEAAGLEVSPRHRVVIHIEKPFPPGRNRVNCTLPGPGGRWYWFGKLFMVPGRDPDDMVR